MANNLQRGINWTLNEKTY